MSTKLNPGAYDCYAKLALDEPYFVLRAKDPLAPALIEFWAEQRRVQYGIYPKLDEAVACAEQMREWKRRHPEAKPTIPPTPESRLQDHLRTIIRTMQANPDHRARTYVQELENLL